MKLFRSLIRNGLLFILLLGTVGCFVYLSIYFAGSKPVYIAQKQWNPAEPVDHGLGRDGFLLVKDYIESKLPAVEGVVMIKDGKTVFEKYYGLGGPDESNYVHSINKTILAFLVGVALDKKHLRSIDQPLSDFFPEYDSEKTEFSGDPLTLKHLLMAHGLLRWGDKDEEYWRFFYTKNKTEAALKILSSSKKSINSLKNVAASFLMTQIIRQVTSTNSFEYAHQYLFSPLGVDTLAEQIPGVGSMTDLMGYKLKTLDLAKFGYLVMNQGKWHDKQLVQAQWLKQKVALGVNPVSSAPGPFQWQFKSILGWDSFRAVGEGGQYVVLFPEHDLVISIASQSKYPLQGIDGYETLFQLVINALEKKRTSEADKLASLKVTQGYSKKINLSLTTDVPPDILEFIKEFAHDVSSHKIENIVKHYAKGYHQGRVNYNTMIKLWLSRLNEGPVYLEVASISKVRREGNRAYLRGFLSFAFRSIREDIPGVVAIPNIIKSKGRWKWFGRPPYTILLDRDDYFEAEIPADASDFLQDCVKVFVDKSKDLKQRCFSNGFLYKELDSTGMIETIHSLTKNNSPEIRLTGWQPSSGFIQIRGYIAHSDIGWLRLPPGITLQNEENHWRLSGESDL